MPSYRIAINLGTARSLAAEAARANEWRRVADSLSTRRIESQEEYNVPILVNTEIAGMNYNQRNTNSTVFYFNSWYTSPARRTLDEIEYANNRLNRYGITIERIISLADRMRRNGMRVDTASSNASIRVDVEEAARRYNRWPRRGRPRVDSFVVTSTLGDDSFEASDLDEQKTYKKEPGHDCVICKAERREGRTQHAAIHAYNGQPRGGWKPRQVKADKAGYYLGVELETDNFGREDREGLGGGTFRDVISSGWSGHVAAALRLPKTLWYPKRDGSVSGPEFASHPATISYWNANRSKIDQMFMSLLHAGFRSHDNDRCGMHINISRTAFGDDDHLRRFLKLLYSDPELMRKISQRTANSLHWCEFNLRSEHDIDEFIRRTRNNGAYGNKYVVFGAPYGGQRFEFRLPRGTLRTDRFYKNLQWLVSMVDFSKTKANKPKTDDWMRFVKKNENKYPDLSAFLTERGLLPA